MQEREPPVHSAGIDQSSMCNKQKLFIAGLDKYVARATTMYHIPGFCNCAQAVPCCIQAPELAHFAI